MNYKTRIIKCLLAVIAVVCTLALVSCGSDIPTSDEAKESVYNGANEYYGTNFAAFGDWIVTSEQYCWGGASRLMMVSTQNGETIELKRDFFLPLKQYGFYNPSIIGDNIYYIASRSLFGTRFMQYNIRNKKTAPICESGIFGYYADDNNVFFVTYGSDGKRKLVKHSVSDGKQEAIMESDIYAPFFDKGIMYYINSADKCVYSLDLYKSAPAPKKIIETGGDFDPDELVFFDGKAYIYMLSDETIYSVDADGTQTPLYTEKGLDRRFYIFEKRIVYSTLNYRDKKCEIKTYDMSAKTVNTIYSGDIGAHFSILNNHIVIYFPYDDDGNGDTVFYMYTFDGDLFFTYGE